MDTKQEIFNKLTSCEAFCAVKYLKFEPVNLFMADYIPSNVLEDSPIFDGDKLFMQKHLELWKSGMRANKRMREIASISGKQ